MNGAALMSCVAFDFTVPSTVEDLNERPSVAILPVWVRSRDPDALCCENSTRHAVPEEESKQMAETLWDTLPAPEK